MAIPTERLIRKPLLDVIETAGGELRAGEVVDRLAGKFGLGAAELRSQTDSGVLRFQNRVMWARLHLVHAGCLSRKPRGIFRLTELGRKVARGEVPMPEVKKGPADVREVKPARESGARAMADESGTMEGTLRLVDFDPYDAQELPEKPGVYVLYDISERPIYVGEGQDIADRILSHYEKYWFKQPIVHSASYVQIADVKLRKQIEAILIKFLKRNAVLNKQHVDRS